ncbi:hypothetical protein F7725_021484 [Dissostichus mawsoni]|uniref:Myb/SANT-like DNA-binding domain-containing protein n=1 Tax=Dissostichus mawsoni TaxID=36200 RepID=A0A7J5ZBC2_DISMA|nr:hypothetical protein F7725_021484 [Dissostichus mawsoni]
MTLIKVRVESDQRFTGRRHTAKKAWEEILKALGLCGSVTPTQIGKKWDNLKRKYKIPPTGTGTDRGEATAAIWPYFTAMHEAIGGRPSMDPPFLMDSATAAVASGSGSTSTEAVQSQATVEDAEAVKEEDRFNRQQAASEETSTKFLELFEQLVRKE